jgi:thioredoxin reductase
MLTRDGTPPAELYQLGPIEVERYSGRLVTGTVVFNSRQRLQFTAARAFTLQLDNHLIGASRIIVATGGRDELPDVPVLAPLWGKDVGTAPSATATKCATSASVCSQPDPWPSTSP